MRVVLFSTDPSGLDLLPALGSEHELVAVVVPSNRTDSDKVTQLVARAPCQTHVHDRGARLADSVPAADGAISWLYSQIIDGTDLARFEPDRGTFAPICTAEYFPTIVVPMSSTGRSPTARPRSA